MVDFGDIASWTAIALGLLQPHILPWWHKRKRKISFEMFPTLEVGYYNFGPTISVLGTLSCEHSSVVIRELRLRVIRKRDQATHDFTWFVEKPPNAAIQWQQEKHMEKVELLLPFKMLPDQERKIYFVCNDKQTLAHLRENMKGIEGALRRLCDISSPNQNQLEKEREQFLASPAADNARDVLRRFNYWEVGDYEVELSWVTDKNRKDSAKVFTITLDNQMTNQLEGNAMLLLRELSGAIRNATPAFVAAAIKEK